MFGRKRPIHRWRSSRDRYRQKRVLGRIRSLIYTTIGWIITLTLVILGIKACAPWFQQMTQTVD